MALSETVKFIWPFVNTCGEFVRRYTIEFIGTFFLVVAIGLTGDPLTIGLMLAAAIYMGGHISLAHYNPAITLAFWMRKEITNKDVPGYIIAQILGAVTASYFCLFLTGKTFHVVVVKHTHFLLPRYCLASKLDVWRV